MKFNWNYQPVISGREGDRGDKGGSMVKLTNAHAIALTVEPNLVIVEFECGQRRAFAPDELAHLGSRLTNAAESAVKLGYQREERSFAGPEQVGATP